MRIGAAPCRSVPTKALCWLRSILLVTRHCSRPQLLNADQNVWIGANDRDVEGHWVWADGVSLAARGFGQVADGEYQRPPWSAGE